MTIIKEKGNQNNKFQFLSLHFFLFANLPILDITTFTQFSTKNLYCGCTQREGLRNIQNLQV